MRLSVTAFLVLCPTLLVGAETAEIEALLNSGRRVSGSVDGQSDVKNLWIRTVSPGVLLQAGYSWSDVTSVRHGVSQYRGQQMIDKVMSLRSGVDQSNLVITAPVVRTLSKPTSKRNNRIRSIDIDAVNANWDRDADYDGLRIQIAPRNEELTVTPTDAIVEIELIGEQSSSAHPMRRQFIQLGKWTRTVRANQFGPGGVQIELPYQRRNGGHRLGRSSIDRSSILSDGVVNVRFKVAGLGTFDGIDPWVRMRPYSRFLDRYRLYTGRESTHYGRSPATRQPLHRY